MALFELAASDDLGRARGSGLDGVAQGVGEADSQRGARAMAALDGLNARFGRRTVQVAAALGAKGGGPVPVLWQAAWRISVYTIRLEDLMTIS